MNIRDIAFKNLLRRKSKSAFILAGLVIGVATVVAVISFVESTTHDINTKLEKYGANILIVPRTDNLTLSYGGMSLGGIAFDMQPIRQSEITKIRMIKNAGNIAAVGPIVLGAVQIGDAMASLAGIDFESAHILKPWWKINGQTPGADGLILGAEVARVLGLNAGDNVDINGRSLAVTGLLAPTGSQDDQLIFAHLQTAQAVLDKPEHVSMVEVAALCHDCPVDEMVAQIAEKLPTAKVMAIQQVVKGRMETLSHFKQFSFALSVVVVAVGGLVVLVTLMGSVRERTEEIGILRAVGFRKSHVMRIIFMEAGVISFLAGILGYLIGVGGIRLGLTLFGQATTPIHVDPVLAAGAVLMAMSVGLLSSTYPAVMATRMDPNQALKTL
ncbi:MAG: ABC transporter permease [Desulfobacteraceae bacterium]|nr:MAG: ABC transporter permease [Desulfobacteraceae bacterium]